MPSPESPANRMITRSSCSTGLELTGLGYAFATGMVPVVRQARSHRAECSERTVRAAIMAWVNELTPADLMVLLGLLAATSALLALAPRLRIPYPILLVLGGLALGFVPGIPAFELPPELVLVGILPPLLYSSAFFTSLRDLRANARPIGLLAVGLVLMTMVVVAVVAHEAIGLDWAAAFVLGAVVSPTDPIAATAISKRLGVPRRLVVIVEGESLVNDATALVALRVAVVAAVSGTFSLWHAGARLRARRHRRHRRRALCRLGGAPGPTADRRPARRGHDLASHGLLRLHPGRPAARLGCRRGRDGRGVSRLAHPGADEPRLAPTRRQHVGDHDVRVERAPVRAPRPAAARASSTPSRASRPGSCSGGRRS